jgi:hypothetical protein
MLKLTFTVFMLLHGAGKPIEALEIELEETFTSIKACERSAADVNPLAQDIQRMLGKKKKRSRIAHIKASCSLVDGREA